MVRKHYQSQHRFDCSPIAQVELNLECRDEIVPDTSVRNRNELNRRRDVLSEPCGKAVSSSLFTDAGSTLYSPNSVNPFGPVNRERSRDSAILAGVGTGMLVYEL